MAVQGWNVCPKKLKVILNLVFFCLQTPAVTLSAAPAHLEIIARPASRQTPQPAAATVYSNAAASYDLVPNGSNGATVQARPVNVVRQAVEIKR